ncbi:MAG: hypothetical protein M1820_005919 [Bogoriella megaspora]|nr:MAG: hypothetical protein M1820_005919 [Bogoriella megaspora]
MHSPNPSTTPPQIYNPHLYLLVLSSSLGGTLFGFDTGIIGGILTLPPFISTYQLPPPSTPANASLSSNIVSILNLGCFIGALLASPVADRLGRKPALLIAAAVASLGCALQAGSGGSGSLGMLMGGRAVAGLGVGMASMVVPAYVAENAPRGVRGGLTGVYQLAIATGVMIAFWINYGCAMHLKGKAMFVVPLSLQALPAVLLFFSMLLCNESPRWLARNDKWDQAERALSMLRNLPITHPFVKEELSDIRVQLDREKALVGGSSFWDLQKEMWTLPGNRRRAILSILLMICQQMTGTNAINVGYDIRPQTQSTNTWQVYAPTIFQNLGIKGSSTDLFATGIYGIVKMLTCAAFLLFVADSLGRRKSLLWTSAAQGLAMFYIGFYVRFDPLTEGQDVPPAGILALLCIFLFAGFFQFGWGPVPWIYTSEIPTARLRAQNVSLAAATQWLFNFVVTKITPVMFVTLGRGGYGTFMMYGSFCFAMGIFAWFFVPETKGISLEKMDELFGVVDSVKDPDVDDVARHLLEDPDR